MEMLIVVVLLALGIVFMVVGIIFGIGLLIGLVIPLTVKSALWIFGIGFASFCSAIGYITLISLIFDKNKKSVIK